MGLYFPSKEDGLAFLNPDNPLKLRLHQEGLHLHGFYFLHSSRNSHSLVLICRWPEGEWDVAVTTIVVSCGFRYYNGVGDGAYGRIHCFQLAEIISQGITNDAATVSLHFCKYENEGQLQDCNRSPVVLQIENSTMKNFNKEEDKMES
ncbi:hypothetical protein VNO77_17311 [Canavalia gladiata]|uniref:Uncharacterized protein n=1 Tax=Canavalia gladiata TaxID=3824 RepID=A0AAN9LIU3_CANGL